MQDKQVLEEEVFKNNPTFTDPKANLLSGEASKKQTYDTEKA